MAHALGRGDDTRCGNGRQQPALFRVRQATSSCGPFLGPDAVSGAPSRAAGEEAEGGAEQGMAGNYRSPAAKACSWMKRHPAKAAAPSSSESPALESRGEFPTMT